MTPVQDTRDAASHALLTAIATVVCLVLAEVFGLEHANLAMFQIGHADPTSAVSAAEGLFAAVVLGVLVAAVVTWLSGAEGDLGIQFGTTLLLPLHGDWENQSLMLAVTVLLVLLGAHALGL